MTPQPTITKPRTQTIRINGATHRGIEFTIASPYGSPWILFLVDGDNARLFRWVSTVWVQTNGAILSDRDRQELRSVLSKSK